MGNQGTKRPLLEGLQPCHGARQAICIGHPERNRAVTLPVRVRLMAEPEEEDLRAILNLGYVVYREVCSGCSGTGTLGNSTLKCRRCKGSSEGDSLREAGHRG